ncbi:MAG: peptidoglycan DD-metalloendopeptidase family protein [Xanthobacteraceae bacterium]
MDQSRQHAGTRSDIIPVDLGNEPPLSVDGTTGGIIDRRRVSVQWFSGTILTGLCGAALMGGAIFASLDGETNFATLPDRIVDTTLRGPVGERATITAHKSDKLPQVVEPAVARQTIRFSQPTHWGEREAMRVRQLTRIAGNLSLSVTELSAKIPPFNPQRLLADAGADGAPEETPAAEPDAEVSFVTRELAGVLPKTKVTVALALSEVLARVREAATPVRVASAVDDPNAWIEARIVPENVTLLQKTAPQTTGGNAWSERAVPVKKGDSIPSILRDLGTNPDEAKAIAATFGQRGRDGGLKEGQKLLVLLATTGPSGPTQRLQPVRVIVAGDKGPEAVVALSDMGKYVSVDVRSVNTGTEVADTGDDDEDEGHGVRLYQSVYETALRYQVPRPVIDNLVRIYSFDVDFQHRVRPGDSFEVLFDEEGANDAKGEVLYAALTTSGESRKYYRFQSSDDGVVDYYDETGKSAKKFLVRKPVAEAEMRSPFGVRRHPILGYTKMHTGVDWATAAGTPIFAAGNGTVEKAGWEGGYGKYVKIRHANGYETAYGHMTAFARNIQPGTKVRQGQVIGFVGSTGVSTGPHVHYEILVNGNFVDPLKIKLPRGRALDGPMLGSFEKERERIDAVMTRNPPRAAMAQGQSGG